jgi:hypothetical protein
MAGVDDVLAQIPMDDLAARLGVDPATAADLSRQAIPALLAGMGANAQDPDGAASLAAALGQHDPSELEGGVDLDAVDEEDGDKIVHNVFGDNTDAVVAKLGAAGPAGGGAMQRLLPMLAPIVMAYLAKQMSQPRGGQPQGSPGGGGLGDVLGGMLGGGSSRGGASGGGLGGGLGDLLGGLLGGAGRGAGGASAAGGAGGDALGGLLEGLLGGGRRR